MYRKNVLFFVLFSLVILVGCSKEQGGMPPTGVESMVVSTRPLSLWTELSGRVSALYVSDVRPQVSGIIKERFFEEGSMVKEGQVLYQIDPALYEADYQNAKANLAHAKATARVAELLAKRYAQLVKGKAVSQQEYDNANAEYLKSKAAVVSAEAAVASAQINLDYTKVMAPVSGRIGRSAFTKGALVTANQGAPLALIQQVDSMYVDVSQSSFDAMRLRQLVQNDGIASVDLIFQDGSTYPLQGKLEFIDITVDQSTDMVNIRFVFPNDANHSLLPGMYVTVRVAAKPIDAVLVPQKTLTRDAQGGYIARVLRAPSAAELEKATSMFKDLAQKMQVVDMRHVNVSRTIGVNEYYVADGLQPGETILYSGFQKTAQGSFVLAKDVTSTVNGAQGAPATPPSKADGADQTAPEGAR